MAAQHHIWGFAQHHDDYDCMGSWSDPAFDTLTESTFSPHSPSTSSCAGAGQGLAPRPSSYQRPIRTAMAGGMLGPGRVTPMAADAANIAGVGPFPSDAPEPSPEAVFDGPEGMSQMSHRSVHPVHPFPAQWLEETAFESSLPGLAASAVTRSPPVGHRQPLPYTRLSQPKPLSKTTYDTSSLLSSAKSRVLPTKHSVVLDNDMASEEYYTNRHEDHPHMPGHQIDHVSARRVEAPKMTSPHLAAGPPPRELGGPSQRRKKFANDRSPLQRLELTLDSLTKEEKRARVQAAEQRARERAVRRASEVASNIQGESRNRQASADHQGHYSRSALPNALATDFQSQISQPGPPQNRHSHKAAEGSFASTSNPQISRQGGRGEEEANLDWPAHNLTFRERSALGERGIAAENVKPAAPPTAFFTGGNRGGIPLPRNESKQSPRGLPGKQPNPRRVQSSGERAQSSIPKPPLTPQTYAAIKNKELPPVQATPESSWDAQHQSKRAHGSSTGSDDENMPGTPPEPPGRREASPSSEAETAATAQHRMERHQIDQSAELTPQHRGLNVTFEEIERLRPGQGLYKPPIWLDEVQKATVGSLEGTLLDLNDDQVAVADKSKAWWESGNRGHKRSYSSRPRKAEAFDGEYDDKNAPTRFKPPLYLKCGPLLRYCGIRKEDVPAPTQKHEIDLQRELWRGSIMIVTQDSESSYDIAPTLRLFVQDIGLLPPPPHQVNGDLPPEYVDPIAGHPKLGRRGETLYVRPVENLPEARDLSRDETDDGLFESFRVPLDASAPSGLGPLPQSFAGRQSSIRIDGEKVQKYKDVRGFRLHVERGCTFWRFNIEIELKEVQQRIAYRINRGPCMAFWVPARSQAMNIMFHSGNGFSGGVNRDDYSGPDPLWRDVLNTHQSQPFHAMLGGGNQIYNESIAHKCALFDAWLDTRDAQQKHSAALTTAMQEEMEGFYLERYCTWFSQGLFALAASQIPMVNMYDDHDIFDGYGSYPHHYMKSPVFTGLGAVAFKYNMLFQHQSILTETEKMEPSWILGQEPGPYIRECSRNVFVSMGAKVALLAVDCRTERTEHEVIHEKTWNKITNRLYAEIRRGQVEHLLVLFGVPIAYPRLMWLENILTSRLMDPFKALGRIGILGRALHNFDEGVEGLDELNNHWTAKNHKQERCTIVEDLQDLAIDKSLRITMLSGDVHLAAVGQFRSNSKLGMAKHRDPRYMVNIVSSAIANAPPSNMLADVLNRRNKVHRFDKQTEECMVPLFQHGVEGKPRKNKHLLPHRNWCSIRAWSPGRTPPSTPPEWTYDGAPGPEPMIDHDTRRAGFFRRLSSRGGAPRASRPDAPRTISRGDRPPISGAKGGLFRSLSRRDSSDAPRAAESTRPLSIDVDEDRRGNLFNLARRGSRARPDDGGINGQWGEDSDDDVRDASLRLADRPSGLRGGGGGGGTFEDNEFSEDDEAHFTVRPPQRANALHSQVTSNGEYDDIKDAAVRPRPFHRTPTGLSAKQMRRAGDYEVDLEGGLDICLNVEVNPRDPTGITVPYRLLVPRLHYEYNAVEDELQQSASVAQQPSGLKKLFSFRNKSERLQPRRQQEDGYGEDNHGYDSDGSSEFVPRQ